MTKTKIDTKDILEKIKTRPKRQTASFTFSDGIFEEFKVACEKENVPMSRVIEQLMLAFLENLKNKK